jgi:sorbitol-6-phosphate 2-dehydrogenase
MDLKLKNKVALVTGAGSGIGLKIAQAFCKEGTKTVFTDINEGALKNTVQKHTGQAIYIQCDVSDREEVSRLFEEVGERYGRLNILVNNAAVNTADYIVDIREEDLRRLLNVNVNGYVYTTKAAIPLMKKSGYGRLIFINSCSGLKASAGLSLYSASKYFDRGFTIAAALELGKYNITANSICPSDIYPETDPNVNESGRQVGAKSWLTPSLVSISLQKEGVGTLEELMNKRNASNPMRRACTTDDVADLALFLASERASFINGQSVGLNGGIIPY